MTLLIEGDTQDDTFVVKTSGIWADKVRFGNYDVSMQDFLIAAEYVLTNTDLTPNDPRLEFVDRVKSMQEVEGYNSGKKRLAESDTIFTNSEILRHDDI